MIQDVTSNRIPRIHGYWPWTVDDFINPSIWICQLPMISVAVYWQIISWYTAKQSDMICQLNRVSRPEPAFPKAAAHVINSWVLAASDANSASIAMCFMGADHQQVTARDTNRVSAERIKNRR